MNFLMNPSFSVIYAKTHVMNSLKVIYLIMDKLFYTGKMGSLNNYD